MEKGLNAVIFFSLKLCPVKSSAHLIESFPMEYGLGRCAKEKLPIPLEAHDNPSVERNVLSFRAKKLKSCSFILRPILLKLHISPVLTHSNLS